MKKLFLAFILLLSARSLDAQRLTYPVTPKVDHVDDYFGTKVADPYRWLERNDSSATRAWIDAQNKVTFEYLNTIPFREQIKSRLTKIWNYPKYSAPFRAGEFFFFYKNEGLQNQSVLYMQRGLDGTPEVFLDPNTFSQDGTIALSSISVSNDDRYLAYSISKSGSDWVEIFVMEIATKKKLDDHLQWGKFTGMSWFKNGFFYRRYDKPATEGKRLAQVNEYQKVYYHAIGTQQSEDVLVKEDREHPKRQYGIGATEDERYLTMSASEQGKNGNALSLKKADAQEWTPVIETFDDDVWIVDNIGDRFIAFTNLKAPRGRIVTFTADRPAPEFWKEVIPESEHTLAGVTSTGGKLFVTYMVDAHHRVYRYSLEGKREQEIALPTLCTVSGFGGKRDERTTFYSVTSFTHPSTIYRYDLSTGKSTLFRQTEIDIDFSRYVTKQVFYKSKDGTRVPMFIVHKKGVKLDGANPTLLYGYGGFNVSLTPSFSASRFVWLENGGIYAMANLRGGNEYGEKWHEGGMRLNKQNVFDDFIAAAEYLIKSKYTSPKRLAIQGGSNGGLLVGAVMNQRPDLFRVALPAVGVMDMLRYHKYTIGWAWINDYGSSDDEVNFKNLYSYSPLHNISAGKNYPATLVTTADHDDRVVPAHSFKYIATLQEKYRGDNPVLIRIETKAGHGAGKPTTKQIQESTDVYSFLFFNLGITPKY